MASPFFHVLAGIEFQCACLHRKALTRCIQVRTPATYVLSWVLYYFGTQLPNQRFLLKTVLWSCFSISFPFPHPSIHTASLLLHCFLARLPRCSGVAATRPSLALRSWSLWVSPLVPNTDCLSVSHWHANVPVTPCTSSWDHASSPGACPPDRPSRWPCPPLISPLISGAHWLCFCFICFGHGRKVGNTI